MSRSSSVTKPYSTRINLKIYEDQITTIIGKSGTGKSVLLKHIIGLLKPDGGAILFEGKPVRAMKKSEWEDTKAGSPTCFRIMRSSTR